MTVDPKLTASLMLALLVVAAPAVAHHKESHPQGNTDEAPEQGQQAQDGGVDRSQDQPHGPPAHAQGDRHAQTSLPGEETGAEEGDEEDETAGSPDESTDTHEDPASEASSATDSTAEDRTVSEEGPTSTTDTQDADQEHSPQASEPTAKPAPDLAHEPEATSEGDAPDGTAAAEPATMLDESRSGSQGAFTGRLTPTTGQPLASTALSGGTGSQGQGSGAQAAASQAPGWDLAPLILIGLAALTGGAMATRRRPERSTGHAPSPSIPAAGPSEATEPPERPKPSQPGPGTSLPPGAPALLELAQEAVGRGDHEGAIGWFETAIALQPELPVAHLCLGVCLAQLGRDEEALESLGHAAQLAPGDPVPVYHQARILARTGRSQEALGQLARVVPVLPGEMVEALAEDEAFASLADHPRFLALTGRL